MRKIGTAFRVFSRQRMAFASLLYLCAAASFAILAPWVTPQSYEVQDIQARLEAPSAAHIMGTDDLGRDLYSRVVYGARVSLAVGLSTAIVSLLLGTLTGAAAGYFGGRLDRILMHWVDIFYIFPMLLTAILLMLVLGRGFLGILVAIGLSSWVTQARLIRGLVLQAREMPYIEAARAMGFRPARILLRHILPNLWGPVIVSLTFQIPTNILAESFLSFIGLGLQPPYASWGTLANEGFRAMQTHPYMIIFPGTALFVTMLAFNFLGDGLRDLLDPRIQGLARQPQGI